MNLPLLIGFFGLIAIALGVAYWAGRSDGYWKQKEEQAFRDLDLLLPKPTLEDTRQEFATRLKNYRRMKLYNHFETPAMPTKDET